MTPVRVDRLKPGPYRMEPVQCPGCGYIMTKMSGFASGGNLDNTRRDPCATRIMVCARCEVAIARWQDNSKARVVVLALDERAEAELPPEVRESLREARNQLRIDKALGKITVPPMGSP
jgi:hypothetical protein